MSHVFTLTDEEYVQLQQAAQRQERTPEELFREWLRQTLADADPLSLEAARARWAALGPEVTQPTDDELRESPLLRAIGIAASGQPGWADQHDEIIAEEAMDSHADE
ncbi:MAG: hypothetical protein OJF49_001905 [Ktedonobacterales bacterium]|jgi:hypothetical protein|nr:MAG: hypothetical protein OJF49_001905 [Ktedonobacterales bacterium]